MAIQELPVWPFEANWSSSVTETFEWLTSVLSSPTGVEQRRALRLYPRKSLEFPVTVQKAEASALDRFITAFGSSDFYLPMWHEAYWLVSAASGTTINVDGANNGGLRAGDVLFIGSTDRALSYELVEVASISGNTVTLTEAISLPWAAGSKVFPVRRARLSDQPTVKRITDEAIDLTISCRIMERNDDVDELSPETYLNHYVLTDDPDMGASNTFQFERMVTEFDNQTGLPVFRDNAARAFRKQTFLWSLSGRAAYANLKAFFHVLRGKQKVLWLPSFNADVRLTQNVAAGNQSLVVEDFGYTDSGGVVNDPIFLCIFMADGTKIFRHITSSSKTSGNREVLNLNQAFTAAIAKESVLRISFMQLSRLDQDRIEFSHKTDTRGLTTCVVTFRSAPYLRRELAGF